MSNDPSPSPPSPASRPTAGSADDPLRALAARWAAGVLRTSHLPHPREYVVELLRELVRSLADTLRSEPFDPKPAAAAAGARLVAERFTGVDTLGLSIDILSDGLAEAAGLPSTVDTMRRLSDLYGHLATAYIEKFRGQLFAEQEMIKRAVITAQQETERKRTALEARLQAVFSATTLGIGIGDLRGNVIEVNPAMRDILGYSPTELRGRSVYELIDAPDRPRLQELFRNVITGRSNGFTDDCRWLNRDGEPVWIHLTVSLVRDETGAPEYPIAMVENTTELNLLQHGIANRSTHDDLTGLANTTMLHSQLESVLARADAADHVALCFFDLDGFKVINDGLGRAIGDDVLKGVARTLQQVFADADGIVARTAGDGFAVLVPRSPGTGRIIALVEETLEQLREPRYIDDCGVAVSASVGIVEHRATGITVHDIVTAGEIATHLAKTRGKSQWVLYEPSRDGATRERLRLAAAMPGALETGEFDIAYQPLLTLAGRDTAAVRSIVRWRQPDGTMLPAEQFLDLAEQTGLVVPMSQWVLDEVCAQAARWHGDFGTDAPALVIELPTRAAADQDLVRDVRDALHQHDLAPERLVLTLPAETLTDPHGVAADSVTVLAELGMRILAGGLGAGNCSLAQLRDLPLHGITVGSALCSAISEALPDRSPFERAVADLAGLAHEVGLTVTAGGLDSTGMVNRIATLGVDDGYGVALAAPAGADAVTRWLAQRRPPAA